MVETILSYLFTLGDFGQYMNSQGIVQNAINLASMQLYNQYKPMFGVDKGATDQLQEMYHEYPQAIASPLVIANSSGDGNIIDEVIVIRLLYPTQTTYKDVQILPMNEYDLIVDNPVIPPRVTRPKGKLLDSFSYEILPTTYTTAIAGVLALPTVCEFSFVDNGTPIPTVTVVTDLNWLPEKANRLTYLALINLGLPVSSQLMMQFGQQQASVNP